MTQFRQRRYLKIGLGLLLSLLIVVGIQFFQPELKGLAQQFLKAVGIQFSLLPSANPVSIPPLPQQQLIKAYFNHNQAASYTDPYRKITRPGDNLEQLIIDNINQAKSSIDIAVQELRLPKIVQALSDRSNAGVKVRLIIENTYNRGYSEFAEAERAGFNERERGKYTDFKAFADLNGDGNLSQDEINQRDSISMLKNAKIPYLDDRADGSSGSGLMHHKFVVIDGTIIVVTSANFTMSDIHGDFTAPMTTGNKNNALRIESPEVAKLFTEEFELMWKDKLFGSKKPHRPVRSLMVGDVLVDVKFSPDSSEVEWKDTSNGVIGNSLNQAQKSADMALFVFAEPELSNLLETKHNQNVEVQVLIDPSFAYRDYSAALDMWGYVSTQDCRIGNSRPWAKPISTVGVPNLVKGDLLHHKFGVADSSVVITGSHNWSNSANRTNDETLLVIHSPIVGAHYQREFDRLFDDAQLGITEKVKLKAKTTCPQKLATTKKRRVRKNAKPPIIQSDQSKITQPDLIEDISD
jgi:phosphatidylserine/phosphatidylglycerophosphate/cardiolipin synthase-like enzyme